MVFLSPWNKQCTLLNAHQGVLIIFCYIKHYFLYLTSSFYEYATKFKYYSNFITMRNISLLIYDICLCSSNV